jgi:hypothetical protein
MCGIKEGKPRYSNYDIRDNIERLHLYMAIGYDKGGFTGWI